MSTWEPTVGVGGYVRLPTLPERSQVEVILSPAAHRAWTPVAEHGDRYRAAEVEAREAEAADEAAGVEAVKANKPIPDRSPPSKRRAQSLRTRVGGA
jgi:hypothetical protein